MNLKIGSALYKLRKELKLSQQDVADIINCSRSAYSCWEHDDGEIPFTKILKLLTTYHIPITAFLKKVEEQNSLLPDSLYGPCEESIDIKAELSFISDRINFINLSIKQQA